MSRFFSRKYDNLVAYTPGEQPRDQKYVKLNTNESPFSTSDGANKILIEQAKKIQLYSDPTCKSIRNKIANLYGVKESNVIMSNGSDEILNFSFMAFSDKSHPVVFPEISYGFYEVFANVNGTPFKKIPLKDDFTINVDDYLNLNQMIVIANPNAPTGIALSLSDIERIVSSNKDSVVVIDEAYIDFGGESAVSLIKKYDNLLVTQTFSKSRSLAGARLGFGIACESLINDLETIRYSTNPYNINSLTMALGCLVLDNENITRRNIETIKKNRNWLTQELEKLDFRVLDSKANFVFAESKKIGGKELYLKLKEKGVLVRHFDNEKISNFNRITIGSIAECETLIQKINEILKENI